MKRYEIKITPYANEQLKEIRDYISQQLLNPDAARNTLRTIQKAINSLSAMPGRLRTVNEEPWKSQGIRKIPVKNYYIYYWIDEEALVVYVTAVAYAMRNQIYILNQIRE